MKKYFRADGLVFKGKAVVATKETNLPFIGATWRRFEGIVWHLSEKALYDRLRHRGSFELRVTQIEVLDFLPLYREFRDVEFRSASHEREQ